MMTLAPTPVRLKLLYACDQWHSARVFAPLTGRHCKLHPNTEGRTDFLYRTLGSKNHVLTEAELKVVVEQTAGYVVRVRVRVRKLRGTLLSLFCWLPLWLHIHLGWLLAPTKR
jgi:hypothetical protein